MISSSSGFDISIIDILFNQSNQIQLNINQITIKSIINKNSLAKKFICLDIQLQSSFNILLKIDLLVTLHFSFIYFFMIF